MGGSASELDAIDTRPGAVCPMSEARPKPTFRASDAPSSRPSRRAIWTSRRRSVRQTGSSPRPSPNSRRCDPTHRHVARRRRRSGGRSRRVTPRRRLHGVGSPRRSDRPRSNAPPLRPPRQCGTRRSRVPRPRVERSNSPWPRSAPPRRRSRRHGHRPRTPRRSERAWRNASPRRRPRLPRSAVGRRHCKTSSTRTSGDPSPGRPGRSVADAWTRTSSSIRSCEPLSRPHWQIAPVRTSCLDRRRGPRRRAWASGGRGTAGRRRERPGRRDAALARRRRRRRRGPTRRVRAPRRDRRRPPPARSDGVAARSGRMPHVAGPDAIGLGGRTARRTRRRRRHRGGPRCVGRTAGTAGRARSSVDGPQAHRGRTRGPPHTGL